eukprot:PhM_4_TR13619/c0_g1_i1/m.9476
MSDDDYDFDDFEPTAVPGDVNSSNAGMDGGAGIGNSTGLLVSSDIFSPKGEQDADEDGGSVIPLVSSNLAGKEKRLSDVSVESNDETRVMAAELAAHRVRHLSSANINAVGANPMTTSSGLVEGVKDGDVAYDSDEGFSVVKKKSAMTGSAAGTPPPRVPSMRKQTYSDDGSDDSNDDPGRPPPAPPVAPVSQIIPTPPSSRASSGYESVDSRDGAVAMQQQDHVSSVSSTNSTPRMVPAVQQSTPLRAHTPPATLSQQRYASDAVDDNEGSAYSDDFDEHINSPTKEAWHHGEHVHTPDSAVGSQFPNRADGTMSSNSELIKQLKLKNADLEAAIATLKVQMSKLRKVAPVVPKRGGGSQQSKRIDAATRTRINSEYSVVKKENDALRARVKQFERIDVLEERVLNLDKEQLTLQADNKKLQNAIRANTKRLAQTDAIRSRREKTVDDLKTERRIMTAKTKKEELNTKTERNHKRFVEKQLNYVDSEASKIDDGELRNITHLTAVLEELEKDTQTLQYRLEVLRKAKESASRLLAVETAKARENLDIELLKKEIDSVKDKIRHFDAHLLRQQDPGSCEGSEATDRALLDKTEALEFRAMLTKETRQRQDIIAAFLTAQRKKTEKAEKEREKARKEEERKMVKEEKEKEKEAEKKALPEASPGWITQDTGEAHQNEEQKATPRRAPTPPPPTKPPLSSRPSSRGVSPRNNENDNNVKIESNSNNNNNTPQWLSKNDAEEKKPMTTADPSQPSWLSSSNSTAPVATKAPPTQGRRAAGAGAPVKTATDIIDDSAPSWLSDPAPPQSTLANNVIGAKPAAMDFISGVQSSKTADDDVPSWLR